jgi:hypothetical protein
MPPSALVSVFCACVCAPASQPEIRVRRTSIGGQVRGCLSVQYRSWDRGCTSQSQPCLPASVGLNVVKFRSHVSAPGRDLEFLLSKLLSRGCAELKEGPHASRRRSLCGAALHSHLQDQIQRGRIIAGESRPACCICGCVFLDWVRLNLRKAIFDASTSLLQSKDVLAVVPKMGLRGMQREEWERDGARF